MNSKQLWILILALGLGVAVYAGLRSSGSTPPEPAAPEPQANALPPGHPPLTPSALPPGHPPVGGSSDMAAAMPPAAGNQPGALEWKPPARWQSAPNPSSMRLATFRIPKAGSDPEDAELSISRAGGSATANIDRWIGQFDEAGQKSAKKSERTVAGFKTTLVEIEGAFASGNMMGGPTTTKPGFMLLGAMVETPTNAHFFKLTGPAATVKAARTEFDNFLATMKAKP